MEFVDQNIWRYAEQASSRALPLLDKIEQETRAHVPRPRMLSGYLQGRVLSMISKMIAPQAILEIGTYTGYSALCLAEGLAPGGRLITLDNDETLAERTRNYFEQAKLTSIIDYRMGDARQAIPTLPDESFNLVFIDADKRNYPIYYDMVLDKVTPGGYILADNVLWQGKVLAPQNDNIAQTMYRFNEKVTQDKRVENVLIPIRDGIMLIRKNS